MILVICFKFNHLNVHQWPYVKCIASLNSGNSCAAVQGRFPGGEGCEFAFQFFEGSNEQTIAQLASAQNETVLRMVKMNHVKILTHCKAKHLMAQYETRYYVFKAELKMDASLTVKE